MHYVFDIFLSEEDYIDFNIFHATRTPYGKRLRRGLQGMLMAMFAIAAILVFLEDGITPVTAIYALLMVGFGLLLSAFVEKSFCFSVKNTIRTLKKSGKLPFSPEARLGFTDEGILEITPEGRLEKRWESMERLCILEGKVWYLFMNNTAAFILPVEQIAAQTDLAEFRRYLESRCPVVERFEK